MHGRSSRSGRDLLIAFAFVAGGVVTGTVGWIGRPLAFALAVFFPALWAFAPSRFAAALVAFAHFLGASRGLPQGVTMFFGTQFIVGLSLWVAASLVFVAVHAALWTPHGGWLRALRFGIAAVLMALPPFGIVGWAHPITAAGVLFPGWGFAGLASTFALLLAMTTRAWPIAAAIACTAFVWSAATWIPPPEPAGWRGIDTAFGFQQAQAAYQQQLATVRLVKETARSGVAVVVLPESALGHWGPMTADLWQHELAGVEVAVLAGGATITGDGYDNVLIGLTGAAQRVVYRERMPVPVSMWQPWRQGGARAYFLANPVVEFAGVRMAPLICYEQLIVWPVLQSMWHDPDIVVAVGNDWWTGDSSIGPIQRASAQAWAALFGKPLVTAFNQ